MKNITIKEVEEVAFTIAQQALAFDEPIPGFSTRFSNKLESCIAMPFMKYGGKDLYSGLLGKAAILLYLLIKNHPFQNGNKRVALTTTLIFLRKNGKWIQTTDDKFYNLLIWIAGSPSESKEATVEGIKEFLKNYMINWQDIKS